ncbi:MAG: 6-phospho-beta-glucosidase [candidate division FCPU426 bacterium]
MKKITLCIVGAGSSYTPELIDGLLAHEDQAIPVKAIHLADRNPERLAIMAGLTERMVRHSGRDIKVRSGSDLAELLKDADFVVSQIRVGGMKARYLDESIPPRFGMIGQETTGPGGMFKALRTIPEMIEIAQTVARVSPNAFLLNYTNPSGIIAEAVLKHSKAKLIGLCSGIPGMQQDLKEKLKDRYPDLKSYSVGLNHLGFIYKMVSAGQDVTADAIESLYRQEQAGPDASAKNGRLSPMTLAKSLGAIPIGYLDYFYYRNEVLAEELSGKATRAEQVMKIEKDVLEQASSLDCHGKPDALVKRGGGGYSDVTFGFLKAILHDQNAELVCSVQNQGRVEGIDADASVELSCRVGKDGATPMPVGAIPLAFRGLVLAVKAYETLTVEAAVKRDRNKVIQAMLNHPLASDLNQIERMVDEMLQAHELDFS